MNVAAVYRGDTEGGVKSHPVHREWLQSIGADELIVSDTRLPGSLSHTILRDVLLNRRVPKKIEYDIIVFESAAALYCSPLFRRRAPEATLLFLDTTWRTRGPSAYNLVEHPVHKRAVYYADRLVDGYVLRLFYQGVLDGVLTVSEMMAEHVRKFSDLPIEIVRPTIEDRLAAQLEDVRPSLTENTAVCVCAARGHKGVDILLKAWPMVIESIPDATLNVIGEGHADSYGDVAGVSIRGFINDLPDAFNTASVQIHPARFDASPVSTLEGMRAGLPQIVTTNTGTRSEVEQIDPSLIVPPTPDALASRIIEYFYSSLDRRKTLSKNARVVGIEFEEYQRQGEFIDEFETLINAVD